MTVINASKNKKERKNTRKLFSQFGPILTYFKGESISPFHYNDE